MFYMPGLYLHIPFCHRKCHYCDFFSVPASNSQLKTYPELLIQHLGWSASQGWTGKFDTIYFGGGTPSLLSPSSICKIIAAVDQNFTIAKDAEITLEANPGTVTQQRLADYRSAGVNRLSLGLQTCNDHLLKGLGRLHDRRQGLQSFESARQAGFTNISLDLMFALPGQSREDLEEDLQTYLDLAPEHFSCYGLTAEPGTPLHAKVTSGALSLPDEDLYADSFMVLHDQLSAAGYTHYEIANYARDGFDCRHNLGYWERRPYLGIGAGAHSFHAKGWGSRHTVPQDLHRFRESLSDGRDPGLCLETFDRESALRETVYLALRTRSGILDSRLIDQFGCTLENAFPQAIKASKPWLKNVSGRWSFNPEGWLLFDHLILNFL